MMMYSQFRHYKSWITKLLLLVTLFFGAFLFSTYAGNSQSLQQRHNVELVKEKTNRSLKRIVSFNRFFRLIDLRKTSKSFFCDNLFMALTHSRITKVAVDSSTEKTYLIKNFPFSYLQQKTIPLASCDEIFVKLG